MGTDALLALYGNNVYEILGKHCITGISAEKLICVRNINFIVVIGCVVFILRSENIVRVNKNEKKKEKSQKQHLLYPLFVEIIMSK